MSWIERIPYGAATGRLRAIYERVKGPRGELDNILTVHSLRPHTLEVNQVAAYFAYANRTVSGLGVTTDGDVLGMSPADTAGDDWRHG